jgi:hypothetical protein
MFAVDPELPRLRSCSIKCTSLESVRCVDGVEERLVPDGGVLCGRDLGARAYHRAPGCHRGRSDPYRFLPSFLALST